MGIMIHHCIERGECAQEFPLAHSQQLQPLTSAVWFFNRFASILVLLCRLRLFMIQTDQLLFSR